MHKSSLLWQLAPPTGGYDSDVDREKNMDYGSKTYAQPTRDPTLIKPHLQSSDKGDQGDGKKRGGVSRYANATPRASTTDKRMKITVSWFPDSEDYTC